MDAYCIDAEVGYDSHGDLESIEHKWSEFRVWHIQVFSYSEWRMRVDECESCVADVFFEDWCESWVLNDLADQSICQDECFGSVFGEFLHHVRSRRVIGVVEVEKERQWLVNHGGNYFLLCLKTPATNLALAAGG